MFMCYIEFDKFLVVVKLERSLSVADVVLVGIFYVDLMETDYSNVVVLVIFLSLVVVEELAVEFELYLLDVVI